MNERDNCWKSRACGREPGGARAEQSGVCPAAVASALDGVNDGQAGGRACWLAAGTLCGGEVQGDFARKLDNCLQCPHFARVKEEQGAGFRLGLALLKDSSSWERAEAAVDSMARRVVELSATQEATQSMARFQTMGELMAGISHELCSPLQYIQGNVEFLRDATPTVVSLLSQLKARADELPPDLRDALEAADVDFFVEETSAAIEQSLSGLDQMSKLLVAVKRNARPTPLKRSPTSVALLFDEVSLVCRYEWKYHAQLVVEVAPGLDEVPLFADDLRQVLINLVVNASQAIARQTPPRTDGVIHLRAREERSWLYLEVADNGPGIPESLQTQVFERYFTTKPGGTGQGLSICREVVESLHGGELVLSASPAGTTVRMRLPLGDAPTTAPG